MGVGAKFGKMSFAGPGHGVGQDTSEIPMPFFRVILYSLIICMMLDREVYDYLSHSEVAVIQRPLNAMPEHN